MTYMVAQRVTRPSATCTPTPWVIKGSLHQLPPFLPPEILHRPKENHGAIHVQFSGSNYVLPRKFAC
jgi:hypothetical protein